MSPAKPALRRRRGADLAAPADPADPVKAAKAAKAAEVPPETDAKGHPKSDGRAVPAAAARPPVLLGVGITLLDVAISAVLLLIACAVRCYKLADVQNVIFDEVHYLKFSNWLLTNVYFFDVNPVFGKIVIAVLAQLGGFDPRAATYETPGAPLPSTVQAFAARAPAALLGALTVPVFYRVCRLLRLSTYASVVGACFILFDSMHVIQSRITMVDSILVFFSCLSLLCALMLWDAKNVVIIKRANVRFIDVLTVFTYLVLTGVFCGLSVSVRWTAFAAPMLIFVVSMFGVAPFCTDPLNLLELIILGGSMFGSYFASFAAFLIQANKSGPGDPFMSPAFQACLIGSDHYVGPEGCKMSLWARFVELNATIFRYSKAIRGNDKWGSSWFQWIVNWRGALYYRQEAIVDSQKGTALIYVLMNPAMVLLIDGLMALFVGVLFYTVRYRTKIQPNEAFKVHLRRGSVLFFGWIGSMLPTMVVYRSAPLYAYLPGLFFAQALGALSFDLIPPRLRPLVATLSIAIMISAFAYWAPWVYAIPLTPAQHQMRRWLPRWD